MSDSDRIAFLEGEIDDAKYALEEAEAKISRIQNDIEDLEDELVMWDESRDEAVADITRWQLEIATLKEKQA